MGPACCAIAVRLHFTVPEWLGRAQARPWQGPGPALGPGPATGRPQDRGPPPPGRDSESVRPHCTARAPDAAAT
jgi:hypothetical protein